MKNILLLSVLIIFSCSGGDDNSNDNTSTCNTASSNLLLGLESFSLCDGLIYDEQGGPAGGYEHSLGLYSNSSTCFGNNVNNNDAIIIFHSIVSSEDGLQPGIYYLSGYPPTVGEFDFATIIIDGQDLLSAYYDNNGFVEIEKVGSTYLIQWEFITNDETVVTGSYEGGLQNCGE